MPKRIIFFLIILSALGQSQAHKLSGQSPPQVAGAYRPGAVLAQFDARTPPQTLRQMLAARQWRIEAEIAPLRIVSVRAPLGAEAALVEALRRMPGVVFAELDYAARAAQSPNDPDFALQWALSKINAPAAWNVTTGASNIVIAIVDSGAALDHSDLVTKLWNDPHTPGVHGRHFYHEWTGSGFAPMEDANVQDDYGHGTHVAGIAAAATNNGVGIAGVAWDAIFMPVKVLDEFGDGWYSDIAAGIVYAVDHGARIVNLSLGGEASGEGTLCTAVAYAYQHGALVVAATGNTGGAVWYPAACTHALAVAATDSSDNHPSFSNSGSQVKIAAPGVDIYSTWFYSGTKANGYYARTGTSMAAAHVSGVAALVWSRFPTATNDQVQTMLTNTAIDRGAPGWDPYFGWGRVDACRAVMQSACLIPTFLPFVTR